VLLKCNDTLQAGWPGNQIPGGSDFPYLCRPSFMTQPALYTVLLEDIKLSLKYNIKIK
jgi:hypothetical protein